MNQKVYDCGRCFLKPRVAKKLKNALLALQKYNYGLILYDCYRPAPVQHKLWQITPDRRYVAPPQKGSMHSRGIAIDLSLTDSLGRALDMGTPYDFFGPEAAPSYQKLSKTIRKRRKILKEVLTKQGFVQARSEWWHFSFPDKTYSLQDWQWVCPITDNQRER